MAVTLKQIAEELGVSQMTISRVLNGKASGQVSPLLAEKIKTTLTKYDYRPNQNARNLRASNTVPADSGERNVINMLLPCPGFADKPVEQISEYVELSTAVLSAASEYGWQVRMLPVSQTNDPLDIKWEWLRDLGSGSRVLACSAWFLPLLMELSRRGCRIAMISAEVFWRSVYNHAMKDWSLFTYMTIDGCMQLTEHLLAQGFRRPAAATEYASEPEEPLVTGYRQVMAEQKTGYDNIIPLPKNGQEEQFAAIRAAFRKNPFDALILPHAGKWQLRYDISLQENLGLPQEIRIVFREECSDCRRFVPQLSAIRYPRRELGREAVKALIREQALPGETFFKGTLIEY